MTVRCPSESYKVKEIKMGKYKVERFFQSSSLVSSAILLTGKINKSGIKLLPTSKLSLLTIPFSEGFSVFFFSPGYYESQSQGDLVKCTAWYS